MGSSPITRTNFKNLVYAPSMISDKQAWKVYLRALQRKRRLERKGLPSPRYFQELRTHKGKPLEPSWRLLWF